MTFSRAAGVTITEGAGAAAAVAAAGSSGLSPQALSRRASNAAMAAAEPGMPRRSGIQDT